jgi:hypothetical protein
MQQAMMAMPRQTSGIVQTDEREAESGAASRGQFVAGTFAGSGGGIAAERTADRRKGGASCGSPGSTVSHGVNASS